MSERKWILYQPKNIDNTLKLYLALKDELDELGLIIKIDDQSGGIKKDSLVCRVTNFKDVDFQSLRIFFDPDGWRAFANADNLGLAVLNSLSLALGRDPKDLKIFRVPYGNQSNYTAFFPKNPPSR